MRRVVQTFANQRLLLRVGQEQQLVVPRTRWVTLHRSVQQLADGGIRLVTSIEQLEPQGDGSTGDVPAGFVTPAAVALLLKPEVADATAAQHLVKFQLPEL